METELLWNAWIQIRNRQDREFVFRGTASDAQALRDHLANHADVIDWGVDVEYADLTANDIKEELANWIDGELD
jgi:beta-galactosidase GanA